MNAPAMGESYRSSLPRIEPLAFSGRSIHSIRITHCLLTRSARESTNHTQGIFRGLTLVARFVRVSAVGLLVWSEAAIMTAPNNSHPRYRLRLLRPAASLLTSHEIQMPDRHCLHSECLDGM
jgi:hypothetical protein